MMRFAKELDNYRKKCFELEEKSKKDEIRCLILEDKVEDLRKKNEELEEQITRIQNGEKGKGRMVDLTDEENMEDKLVQLMIENKVLEIEKTKAETELRYWKEKVKELESKVNIKGKDESSIGINDVNVIMTAKTHLDTNGILIDEYRSKVRKRLPFEEVGCLNKKIAPSTPGAARPPFSGVIDISDEDVNYNEISKVKKLSDIRDCGGLTKSRCSAKNELEKTNIDHIDEEDIDSFEVHSRIASSAKRKRTLNIVTSDDEKSNEDKEDVDEFKGHSRNRAANIVTSDDESSYDDDALICTLKTRHNPKLKTDFEDEYKEDASRRRLTRLRKSESEDKQDKSTFDLNKSVCLHGNSEEDDDGVDEVSESEGESLGGFIVDSSESCDESEDALNDFNVTLDKIRRKKGSNLKWDLEGDMLADFGKDPELCMRAVCALYRQQTTDEKASKGTLHQNARGFSQTDAFRASKLAEFLTDGDSSGDLNKTVDELKRYDSKGIKLCMELAAKYSKQLFAIYQNKEDPNFLPH